MKIEFTFGDNSDKSSIFLKNFYEFENLTVTSQRIRVITHDTDTVIWFTFLVA